LGWSFCSLTDDCSSVIWWIISWVLMVVRFGCGELMYDAVAVAEAEGAAAAAVITTLTSAVAALV
jgi:hypothetical protein